MTYPNAPHRWAILASVLVGIIGLQWWLVPQTYPSVGQLGSGWAAALAGLLGVSGMVTGWALGRPRGRIARRLATVGAGLQVVAFGYVASDGADPLYVVSALAVGALWLALVARAVSEVRGRPDSRLCGVLVSEGAGRAESIGAPGPCGGAARRRADRPGAGARLWARRRGVAGM